MSNTQTEVVVVLDLSHMQRKEEFEAYLEDEGFEAIDGEEFAYRGFSDTPISNTRAYIFETFSKAFEIAGIQSSKIACQIGENPFEMYSYEKNGEFFKPLES